MNEILMWISIITGGLLILLMLLSLVGGIDFDTDVDVPEDIDSGGIGYIKGFLTFISVSTWVVRLALIGNKSPFLSISIGIIVGLIALVLLNYLFKFFTKNKNVNWDPKMAIGDTAKVYLKIPINGSGIINISIKGGIRDLKAITKGDVEIPTGTTVKVEGFEGEFAVVSPLNNN